MEIKTAQDVVEAIDEGYAKNKRERPRQYIGASIVGNPCGAYLAYSLRGYPEDAPDPKLQRIFQMGHILEDFVVRDLKRKADVRVWEKDGLTGRQHSYSEWGGHLSCHMDGHVELDDGKVRVLEIKSMNDNSWKKFASSGVKVSHPNYFAQCQMMMAMSGLEETLFIAINKNTQDYHAEIIDFDEIEVSFLQQKVISVLDNQAEKVSTDETDWRCRGCFNRSVCWAKTDPEKECASCANAKARKDGLWECSLHGGEAQDVCDDYVVYRARERQT